MPVAAAVLFDLDGTLVDSTVVVERHWGIFADRLGLELTAILAVCHGRRSIDTIRELAPLIEAQGLDPDALAAELDAREASDTDGLVPIRGARELLAALDPTRWAIVTSGQRTLATARLAATGFPQPAVLICGDETERGKPDPEGYRRAADLLGAAPDACVVVEDTPAGIAAGRALGATVVALTTTFDAAALGDAHVLVPDLAGFHDALARLGLELPLSQ